MKPLDGMKLLLASPTYGPADPECQKQLRVAMMYAARVGVEWSGDASADRLTFGLARNAAAQALLDTDANGIMWVDSDMRQEPHQMSQLLLTAVEGGLDFVSGVYHLRKPPYHATIYHWVEKIKRFRTAEVYPPNVLAPMEACGFGFVYTSRKAIETVARSKEFDRTKGWFPDERDSKGFGEDLSFGYLAMRAGIQLWVHTGIILGHVGDSEVIYPSKQVKREVQVVADGKLDSDWGLKQ